MILRRLGNKAKIAKKIQAHFPPHKIYIEPFFGAGGMFFNKPKVHNNILNDIDNDVFNLFQVVLNQKNELIDLVCKMPIHPELMKYWNSHKEIEPIKKALRFICLSNYGIYGKPNTIRVEAKKNEYKIKFEIHCNKTFDLLHDVQFSNKDFRELFKNISFIQDGRNDELKTFIYNDPPYLGATDNYSNSFTEQDSYDLFEANQKTGCKFAMSEFDHPFILQQAKERNLNVIKIGERRNLKNRRIEILVTNYELPQKGFFDRNKL